MRKRLLWSGVIVWLLGSLFYSHQALAGCVVESSGTYAEGANLRDDKCDTGGNKKVRNNITYSTSAIVTSDTALVSGATVLHCILISQNDAAPTAGTIIIYDNTAESGTQVFNWTLTTTAFIPFQVCLDRPMTNGIYAGFTTTADVNVSVTYR